MVNKQLPEIFANIARCQGLLIKNQQLVSRSKHKMLYGVPFRRVGWSVKVSNTMVSKQLPEIFANVAMCQVLLVKKQNILLADRNMKCFMGFQSGKLAGQSSSIILWWASKFLRFLPMSQVSGPVGKTSSSMLADGNMKCCMWFQSGELSGQSSSVILWSASKFLRFWALWVGANISMKLISRWKHDML